MKRVVIESPLKGSYQRNRRYALACARDCLKRGEAPYASHIFFDQPGLLDDTISEERELGMRAGFAWGAAAELRAVYTDLGISGGMQLGIKEAERLVQPVEHRTLGGEWALVSDRWEIREGDALRLLLELRSGTVDAVVTDTPYSSGGAMRGDRMASTADKYVNSDSPNKALPEFLGDTRDQLSFMHWCALWYSDALRVAKDGAILFTFCDWRQLSATELAVQAGGWVLRGFIPWNKTEATRPQLGRPRAQCEYVVFATKGPHAPWPGAPTIPGFFECVPPRDRIHIAEKPIGLMLELLSIVPPDGLILDLFCGSGTTGAAAIRSGRRAMLFELSPTIAAQARERLAAEERGLDLRAAQAGQGSLFEGEGNTGSD